MVRIIEPSYEILDLEALTPLQRIELAARTCYMSWDYMCDGSDAKLAKHLVDREHWAMIEHASVILSVGHSIYDRLFHIYTGGNKRELEKPKFLRFTNYGRSLISGNLTAFYEFIRDNVEDWEDDISGLGNFLKKNIPVIFDNLHLKNIYISPLNFVDPKTLSDRDRTIHDVMSVRFVANRGMSHEDVRNRCSHAQSSTRYIDLAKDEYGREITVIKPTWTPFSLKTCQRMMEFTNYSSLGRSIENEFADIIYANEYSNLYDNLNRLYVWCLGKFNAEKSYFRSRDIGLRPEFARDDLPIGVKTEIVTTATLLHWKHIFKMRTSKYAHPLIRMLMRGTLDEAKVKFPKIFDDITYEI